MYTEQKNNKKLKALYAQSLHIKSAIPHPLIMGVIRGMCQCIMYMHIALFLNESVSYPHYTCCSFKRIRACWLCTHVFIHMYMQSAVVKCI